MTDRDLHIPSMAPEGDELDNYRRMQSTNSAILDAEPVRGGGGASAVIMSFLFVLILAVGGGASWLYLQLEASNARIATLEQRLSQAGESMDQSSATLGLKLKELTDKTNVLWTEMDKLWASAWRRNQSEITELRDGAANLSKKLAAAQKTLSAVETKTADIDSIASKVKVLDDMQVQVTDLSNNVLQLRKLSDGFGKSTSGLEKRMTSAEDWINSINAYRKQVNRQLDELQKAVAPAPVAAKPAQ